MNSYIPSITMINSPRASGKTTVLKLRMIESYYHKCNTNEHFILLTSSGLNLQRLQDEIQDSTQNKFCFEYLQLSQFLNHVRGTKGQHYYLFIDEPFLVSDSDQQKFLEFVQQDSSKNKYTIYGIGTKPKIGLKFEDYIKD
jgi:hypothetical protein